MSGRKFFENRFAAVLSSTCAVWLVLVSTAFAQNVISKVGVSGNRVVESGTILLQVSSKPGEPVSREKLDNDVKQIYRTGFFEEVEARLEPSAGGVDVVFAVEEKPAIREVKVEGNDEVSEDTFKEKLNLGARRFLDRAKIRASIQQVKQYYEGLGYSDAEIDYVETPVDNDQVDLSFKVTEGEKRVIREVVFEGAKVFDEDELEDTISTATHNRWVSWITGRGIVKKEQLEADVKELSRFYLNHGYVDVRVTTPEIVEIEDGLRVVFKIQEGEQYKIGSIAASGTLLNDNVSETLEGIESKKGEVFNAEQVRKDTFTVSEKFTDKGFAFTNVNPDITLDRPNKLVRVNFQIDKGAPVKIARINITGDRKTEDRVIRRSLQIHEQELFSSSKIKKSQEVLQRLGYFDEVSITPEPSAEPNAVDLNVAVREANTGTFSIGAGVSSGDGFLVSSQISENNLFGTGNSLTLDINTGRRRRNYILSFNNPRVSDTYVSAGVDVLSVRRIFDDFDRSETGGALTTGYPLWFLGPEYLEDVRGSLSYELVQVEISDVKETAPEFTKSQEGKTVSSSITPRLVRNTINNPLDPVRGSRQVAALELAGLGGDQEFYLAQLSNTIYWDFWESPIGTFVFSQRTRFDYGDTFNDERFPLFRRFFPGGINSVRGFRDRQIGPKDENGNEYGGSKQLIANFEMLFPLVSAIGLRGLVFYDAGNAFDDDEQIDFGGLRQAIGWGIRWRSPLAPIRIEFGIPLDKEKGESGGLVTNFSFGAPQ